jgi:peptide/nickel transport system substrate-binding protein
VCTEDKVGGELSFGEPGNAASLDPYDAAGGSFTTGMEIAAIYSALLRYNPDAGEFEGRVAESIESNDDATVWTLKLRPDVTFGNGDKLDAQMVKASMDNILAPDSTSRLRINATYIKSIDVVDPLTVQFTLTGPWGRFPSLLTQNGGLGAVRNMNLVNQMGREAFAQNPTGGGVGPYEIDSYAPPESIKFKAKTDWWGGPVCIESLTFTVLPGAPATLDAFKNGELGFATMIRDPATIQEAEKVAPNSVRQFENSGFMLLMNSGVAGSTPPTTDVRVRRAIAAALDPEVINQRAFGGVGVASSGIVNSPTSALDPTEGPKYDPDLAKQLVDEVKAEKGWDGSIRLIAAANPQANAEAGITIKALLEAVGFKVDLDATLPIAQLVSRYSVEKNYDLAVFGLVVDDPTMWNGLRQWASPNANNLTGYANPALDAGLDELKGAQTLEEQNVALAKIQQVWNDDAPSVPFGASPSIAMWQDDVKGVRFDSRLNPILDGMYLQK